MIYIYIYMTLKCSWPLHIEKFQLCESQNSFSKIFSCHSLRVSSCKIYVCYFNYRKHNAGTFSKFLRINILSHELRQLCTAIKFVLAYLTAKTAKCLCKRGLIVKLPAVGFIQDTYCVFWISFNVNFVLSYLKFHQIILWY